MTLLDKIILNAEKSEYFKELFDRLEKLNFYSFLKSSKREQYDFSNKELKSLAEGDVATFTDMAGNVFIYKMVERETLNPTDIEEMEDGDWDLTLFTCTVGGKTRVTIRFKLDKD